MKSIALTFLLAVSVSAAPQLDPKLSTFLQTYCIDCHGPKKQKGDVNAG